MLKKSGNSTLTLSGNNSNFTGTTVIDGGKITFNKTANTEYFGGTTTINAGGELQYITTTSDKINGTINGSGTLRKQGTEIADVVIEGKEREPYTTVEANNINEKYELVAERLPANATGTIEKFNEEKPQEVIYYYRLKPAKVLINYLEKDEDTDDSNNLVLTAQEKIDGHVDDSYNTDTDHRKETIEKDGKKSMRLFLWMPSITMYVTKAGL